MSYRAQTVALAALAVLTLVGCNRPSWGTPEAAYASLARAAQKGEQAVAWGALSEASRKGLEQRSKALAAAAGGALQDDPRAFFFGSGPPAPPIGQIKVVRREDELAVLAITADVGASREVRMVKEADGWKLDVSAALKD
jgi:hypothetical protein